ncbi:MAG: hypothetical protein BWY06_03393 [Candidatus Latescibacteria bacterium ADurb.Bin168]|nr:MAG: hypothetical protein BWY06_03393 [Candidatus Latescibacteria bacterium ADurb.Bin168]
MKVKPVIEHAANIGTKRNEHQKRNQYACHCDDVGYRSLADRPLVNTCRNKINQPRRGNPQNAHSKNERYEHPIE